ncbi:type II toxin-antitoxin system RelE/ParE family toxin [Streptomyces sp. NPDC020801]|uniref:type II toxin-antitoxin system RelE family toxin n=1 Tax=unclassified Streptomyces TaxID=2593676 RepID=UPI00378E51E8
MTHEIIFEPHAFDAPARFPKEDPNGLSVVLDAIDEPARDPRPAGSAPYGPDIRRLRVGGYRVLHVIGNDVIHILVTRLGRPS